MKNISYLLDENVDPLFRTELLKREPEIVVWKVGDPYAPHKGTLDPEILCWCEEHSFILLTNNRKSMPNHLRDHLSNGRHIPGIFELNSNLTINETIEELLLIWEASDLAEYRDIIIYLPLP
jgi:hypothetical protein